MVILIFFVVASMSVDFPSLVPPPPLPAEESRQDTTELERERLQREQNKEIVYAMIEAYNDRDYDRCTTFFADNYIFSSDSAMEGGPSAMVARMKSMADAFDLTFRLYHLFGEGDQVVYHVEAIGRHIGTYKGKAPTNKNIRVQAMGIMVVVDGKIVEGWEILDEAKLMQQLK
jgi:predicted ester cyclase